ncbi:ester cyclase [uncultured Gilliamella sp.]|uniref:nuclear transport factor 2 family protein n=1 Tax=uncultured Gilliamella sp. TaxID=1193505 RepID=UPI0025D5E50C|nr:ester cyclase [uncultured Gilliamella sp.]
MNNKELVINFYKDIFEKGELAKVANYIADDYIQHNPRVATGRAGFIKFIEEFIKLQPKIEFINVSSENNFVYVFFKCTLANGIINKVCDIYRIENSMLVEHWDVIEHNVEIIKAVHNNGIF